MKDLRQPLVDFVSIFDRLQIPYVVMGGLAVRTYGIPRATYDVDFTIALERAKLPDFLRQAEDFGYTVPDAYQSGWVDQVGGLSVVKLRSWLEGRSVDVDFFLAESPFQHEILARRRIEEFDGLPVAIVSPEDLILLKLIAHRPKDLADIGDVLFTQGQLDLAYMRQWADRLGIRGRLEMVLKQSET